MSLITADVPMTQLPSWAVWERRMLDSIDQSVPPYLEHFTRDDGEFIWEDKWGGGSPDDFYEPFANWPHVYAMGGGDHLLTLAERQWEGVTKQLTRLGTSYKEYGFQEDQMHQSESDVLFYNLCLANPTAARWVDRARRFAGFYLNEDPDAINYDPVHKIVLSGLNGSKGAVYTGEDKASPYNPLGSNMEAYSLPFFDLPGITSVQDLADPAKAKLMGEAMRDRWQAGDAPANLAITSLVTNAFLLTGDEKYRDWVVEYTDAWMQRADQHDGLLPDQVGPSGRVGEFVDGKWYGGRYGWTFPHGFLTMHFATTDAGLNAYLLTRDDNYLELPRRQLDRIFERGEMRQVDINQMSVGYSWETQLSSLEPGQKTFLVPHRYGDAGWFDWQPMPALYPTALWNVSMADQDWQRIERLRDAEAIDWNAVFGFRDMEDAGHEAPWVQFLAGHNPDYPERILHAAHQQLCRRSAQLREDDDVGKPDFFHVHQWQHGNPVTSEALLQLTLGGPQQIKNGGLLHSRLRYFDVDRRRPGLPQDVGALVEKLEADRTVVRFANLSPVETRRLIVQGGAYGEHRFARANWSGRTSVWPGHLGGYAGTYAAPNLTTEQRCADIGANRFTLELPPATEIVLDLATERYVNEPSHGGPF